MVTAGTVTADSTNPRHTLQPTAVEEAMADTVAEIVAEIVVVAAAEAAAAATAAATAEEEEGIEQSMTPPRADGLRSVVVGFKFVFEYGICRQHWRPYTISER